jgi:hypothetical protein
MLAATITLFQRPHNTHSIHTLTLTQRCAPTVGVYRYRTLAWATTQSHVQSSVVAQRPDPNRVVVLPQCTSSCSYAGSSSQQIAQVSRSYAP